MVPANVAEDATPPPVHDDQIQAPTVAEVRAIITAAEELDTTYATMLLLAAVTGARRGELCGLRWSDLDWSTGTLTIERSVYDIAGGGWSAKDTKTHQVRQIAIGVVGLAALRVHRNAVDAQAKETRALDPAGCVHLFRTRHQGIDPIRPQRSLPRSVDGHVRRNHCVRSTG